MTLAAVEFIRRFLLHVLPGGFMKIRHYGFLANRARTTKRELCRRLLDLPTALITAPVDPHVDGETARDADDTGHALCPRCRAGRLHIVQQLPPPREHRRWAHRPAYQDTS